MIIYCKVLLYYIHKNYSSKSMEMRLRKSQTRFHKLNHNVGSDLSSQKYSIPLFGPLKIKSEEKFKNEQRETFQKCFNVPCPQITIDNINLVGLLGQGGFGKVYLVRYKDTTALYAMKVMKKKFLVENGYVPFALNEKRVLQSINFPFCVYLQFMAQDKFNLYCLLPFISGGEMYTHLKKLKQFNEELSRFYAGQVILALEFLHYCNLAYRDLKPENILIDYTGYVKITDFGFTKEVKTRLYTFCGTPDYIAPEIILGLGHSKAVDYWSLGILIYEMVKGKTPFYSDSDMEIFKNIIQANYEIPKSFSKDLQDLIDNLLQADVTKRYGNLQNGVNDIKKHQWFAQTNWLDLLNRIIIPPYIPAKVDNVMKNFPLSKNLKDDFSSLTYSTSLTDYDEYFKDF